MANPISISIKLCPPVLTNGTSNQYSCSTERPTIGKIQHPKGSCVELGNWPIKVQLGSTNSKGLPVLFQGSHQDFLLNNHYTTRYRRPRPMPSSISLSSLHVALLLYHPSNQSILHHRCSMLGRPPMALRLHLPTQVPKLQSNP